MSHITYNSKWHCSLCIDSRQGGREENQDSCGYKETPFGFLVVVCDGMGGGPAGANASILAVQSIIQEVDKAAPALNPEVVLNNAVTAANDLLRRTIKKHRQLMGMGTTCVAALFTTNKVTVAHVGDSRLYQFRNNKLIFKTADHSVVGEMVRKGEITEEEARRAENSNVITRSLGISDTVDVETNVLNIIPGDRIALCTDGVWGMLCEKELTDFLCKKDSIDSILPDLLNSIELLGRNKHDGNYDNLSLGIININNHSAKRRKNDRKSLPFKILIALVLFLSISANIFFFITKESKDTASVYNNVISEEKTLNEKNIKDTDDTQLEEQFAKRREQDYIDSIEMLKQIEAKELNKNNNTLTPNRAQLLNHIAKAVKSLDTPKGGDANKILNRKRAKQQQIIKDFELLRKDFEHSQTNRKKYNDVSVQLAGDVIIATQKDGASTKAARKEIIEVAKQLNALK